MKKFVPACLIAMVLLLCSVHAAQAQQYFPPVEGERACDFTVPLLDGSHFTLSDQRGKVVIVVIWSPTCYFCKQLLPHLQALADNYPDTLTVLGFGGTAQRTLDYYHDSGYSFPLGIGSDENYQKVMEWIFATGANPYTVIIDPYGIVSAEYYCAADYDMVESWYTQALTAAEPPLGVRINAANFPDPAFRQHMLDHYSDGDGCITRASVTIDAGGIGATDLTGIEHFAYLRELNCGNNALTRLDLSDNNALELLDCENNSLTALNVANNPKLLALLCAKNEIASLEVDRNPALNQLSCSSNQLTSLDVTQNTSLVFLHCYGNQLASLDVTQNTELTQLDCSFNQLTSLDVSNNTALTWLGIGSNQLAAIDVSQNTELIYLPCFDNQLDSLDVTQNIALKELECGNNRLTSLDLSNNIELESLGCYNNKLSSLDLAGNMHLQNALLYGQNPGLLRYTQSGGAYQVDLTQLPSGNLIDRTRVTMMDGGILDTTTGIVSYASPPSFIAYHYDTQNSGNGERLLPVTISASASVSSPGDANDDGAVDIMDLVVIVDYIVNGNAPASMAGADANGDGAVDIMDLVFIINLIVNPPVSSGTQVDATAGNMISVEVPFQSAVPITALEMEYNLSPGLTFVNASCSGMVGEGGSTNAVFVNVSGGMTSGTVTLEVALNNGVTANQTINVTAIMGANTAGTLSVGTPQTYVIDVNASALAILTQPVDTTVSVGNTATFTVEATGPEPLTYQWYVNTNAGVGWMAVAGAAENTYTTDAAELGDDGFRYFCRVTAEESYLDSAVATLAVVAYPQTGDSSHPVWMITLMLLAAVTIGGLLLYRLRKSKGMIVHR